METSIYKYKNIIDDISKLILSLSENISDDAHTIDHEKIIKFKENYNQLNTYISTSSHIETEAAFKYIEIAATLAQNLGRRLDRENKYGTTLKTIGTKIMDKASSLLDDLLAKGITIRTDNANQQENKTYLSDAQEKLKLNIAFYEKIISNGNIEFDNLKQKTTEHFRETKSEISNLAQAAEKLKSEINALQEDMLTESKKASEISKAATEHAKEAQIKIDKLLETTSSKVLLLEYSTTADEEEASANRMRWLSLVCMALTGGILLYTVYDTLNKELDWKQSVFRMFIALALSVPAAYLARESAKHRAQQHTSRRIALDLKAVTPYISSLPPEDQIKIKSEVASRIFGVHNNEAPSDSYPLNIQELLKSLIEKIPTKKD